MCKDALPEERHQAWKLLDGFPSQQGVLWQPEHFQVGGVAQDAAEGCISEAVGSPQGHHLQLVERAGSCQSSGSAFCEASPAEGQLQPLQPAQVQQGGLQEAFQGTGECGGRCMEGGVRGGLHHIPHLLRLVQ